MSGAEIPAAAALAEGATAATAAGAAGAGAAGAAGLGTAAGAAAAAAPTAAALAGTGVGTGTAGLLGAVAPELGLGAAELGGLGAGELGTFGATELGSGIGAVQPAAEVGAETAMANPEFAWSQEVGSASPWGVNEGVAMTPDGASSGMNLDKLMANYSKVSGASSAMGGGQQPQGRPAPQGRPIFQGEPMKISPFGAKQAPQNKFAEMLLKKKMAQQGLLG